MTNPCPHCQTSHAAAARFCPVTGKSLSEEQNPSQSADVRPVAPERTEAEAVRRRYRDAYRVADATVSFGNGIKGVGVVLALLIGLGTLFTSGYFSSNQSTWGSGGLLSAFGAGSMLLIPGMMFAGFVGLLFYLLGVLVAAQGQTLLASLDGAVNSSPFLTNGQRADIMCLGRTRISGLRQAFQDGLSGQT